jgi:hypothetical protein
MVPLWGHTLTIDKVVIWGHKLHVDTHSYIHYAFDRSFKFLGYETYWFDHTTILTSFDCKNTLFIAEGHAFNMPIRDDCFYILHNVLDHQYQSIYDAGRAIKLQVYTHDCLERNVEKIDECMYKDYSAKTIYLPWATDLLPHEIDAIKSKIKDVTRTKEIYYVGTIMGYSQGLFETVSVISPFQTACAENDISFIVKKNQDLDVTIDLIQKSYMAPALQGPWQVSQGYIPCRIFKNISYGQFGITNSETVYKLFKKKIIYNPDPQQLFYKAQEKLHTISLSELYDIMDFVRDNHTYINRIEMILDFLSEVYEKVHKDQNAQV